MRFRLNRNKFAKLGLILACAFTGSVSICFISSAQAAIPTSFIGGQSSQQLQEINQNLKSILKVNSYGQNPSVSSMFSSLSDLNLSQDYPGIDNMPIKGSITDLSNLEPVGALNSSDVSLIKSQHDNYVNYMQANRCFNEVSSDLFESKYYPSLLSSKTLDNYQNSQMPPNCEPYLDQLHGLMDKSMPTDKDSFFKSYNEAKINILLSYNPTYYSSRSITGNNMGNLLAKTSPSANFSSLGSNNVSTNISNICTRWADRAISGNNSYGVDMSKVNLIHSMCQTVTKVAQDQSNFDSEQAIVQSLLKKQLSPKYMEKIAGANSTQILRSMLYAQIVNNYIENQKVKQLHDLTEQGNKQLLANAAKLSMALESSKN